MSGAPAPEVKLVKGSDAVVNDAALVRPHGQAVQGRTRRPQCDPHPTHHGQRRFLGLHQSGRAIHVLHLGVSTQKVAEASQPGGKPLPFNHHLLRPEPEPTFKTGVETMTLAVMNVMQ
jgi:hippurate hydrolase